MASANRGKKKKYCTNIGNITFSKLGCSVQHVYKEVINMTWGLELPFALPCYLSNNKCSCSVSKCLCTLDKALFPSVLIFPSLLFLLNRKAHLCCWPGAFPGASGEDSHAKGICAVARSPFLCGTVRYEQATAAASSVSLFFKHFHLRKQFILLLVVLRFPVMHLNPDYREHFTDHVSQAEKLSVRCSWMWAVLQLFTQPVITPMWKQ